MRAIHAVVLLGALGAGCGREDSGDPSPTPSTYMSDQSPVSGGNGTSPAPGCDGTVTITFGRNPDHPAGLKDCDVVAVEPDNVEVCTGHKITWEFVNNCGKKVEAVIGKRGRKYPKGKKGEPLIDDKPLKPKPYPIPTSSSSEVTSSVSGSLKSDAEFGDTDLGLYKYDIDGTGLKVDPEIDVRRPTRLTSTSSRPQSPSPSPSGQR